MIPHVMFGVLARIRTSISKQPYRMFGFLFNGAVLSPISHPYGTNRISLLPYSPYEFADCRFYRESRLFVSLIALLN